MLQKYILITYVFDDPIGAALAFLRNIHNTGVFNNLHPIKLVSFNAAASSKLCYFGPNILATDDMNSQKVAFS